MRASEVPTRPVADLVPYARNSRTHSETQVAQIAGSIRKFGFTNPVLIDGEGGIIAAEMTGRRCFAIELNPAYVDVAVRRWQDFTGRTATLQATGQTFREVAEERASEAVNV